MQQMLLAPKLKSGSRWILMGVLLASTACSEQSQGNGELEAFAQTALGQGQSANDKARKADEELRRKAFAAKKAKEAEEERLREETFTAIITQPSAKPKNVKAACDSVLEQFHEYKVRTLQNDDGGTLDWYAKKKKKLGELRMKCERMKNVGVAACQAHALKAAPAEFINQGNEILNRCVRKFAPDAEKQMAKLSQEVAK